MAVGPERPLEGKVALVTGAARGIGHGVALGLARAGADVVVTDRLLDLGEAVAREVQALGRRSAFIGADFVNDEEVERIVPQAIAAMGRLDVLVNNAAEARDYYALDLSLEELRRCLRVNLEVPIRLCQTAGRHFMERGAGVIVNIGSVAGERAWPENLAYCSTKAGLHQATRVLALEWAAKGVRVNCVAPGLFETEMSRRTWDVPGFDKRLPRMIPAGRLGQPDDIARLVVFLASEAAQYIHGQVFRVDGAASV